MGRRSVALIVRLHALALRTTTLGLLLATAVPALAACGRYHTPEEVALAYGRAVYANDAEAIWRLLSTDDRRVKDEATFHRLMDSEHMKELRSDYDTEFGAVSERARFAYTQVWP